MAKHEQLARLVGEPGLAEPSLAELFDPVALEARLVDARARRAAAIARRNADAGNAPLPIDIPAPPVSAIAANQATEPVPDEALPTSSGRWVPGAKPLLLGAIFLAGLVGGAAAVLLAPPQFRGLVTTAPAPPVAPFATSTLAAAGPAAMSAVPLQPSAPDPAAGVAQTPGRGAPVAIAAAPGNLPSPSAETSPERRSPAARAPTAASLDVAPPAASPTGSAGSLSIAAAPVAVAGPPGALVPPAAEPLPEPAPAAVTVTASAASPEPLGPPVTAHSPKLPPGGPEVAGAYGPADLPAPAAEAPAPEVGVQLASLPAATEPPAGPAVSAARVYVHYPPGAAAAASLGLEALRTAGVAQATGVAVRLPIRNANVRYFHLADRDAALDVARSLASSLGGSAPEARDFTDFRPLPESGTIEVWLPGDRAVASEDPAPARPAAAARPKPAAAATPRRVAADQPAARQAEANQAVVQRKAEQVERSLLQNSVVRMLQERNAKNRRR